MAQGEPLPDETLVQLAFEPRDRGPRGAVRPRFESVTLAGGEAVLERAPLGPQRVLVYPSTTAARRTTRYVDQEFELDLSAGDSSALRCDFVLGGNVALEARAPEGQLVAGWCKLFDASGQKVAANFHTEISDGSYGGFTDKGPTVLLQNLPPGRYTLQLETLDYALFTDVLEIRAGEVTTRTFALTRR